ncbi:hypothetical protein B0H11DRAFT_2216809 [Mycena galericulata]|nr:hypothetical protein B0H11DRAFT_2266740 [Mycena galericulata]KAJ7509942.1 hypothetical protein B0H11DRAFT_2216809 [Mycena galericulata]
MTPLPKLPNPDERLRNPCAPPFFPGPDFVDVKSHDETSTKKWYLVKRGRTPGLYTDCESADAQTNHFSGAKQKSFPTRAPALSEWMRYCRSHHVDGCPAPTPRPPSLAPPSPPSPPSPPTAPPAAPRTTATRTALSAGSSTLTQPPTPPATPARSRITMETRVHLSPLLRSPASPVRTRPHGYIHPTLQFAAMGVQPPASSGPRTFYALRGISIHFAERAEAIAHATRMGLEGYELGWSSDLDELESFIAS